VLPKVGHSQIQVCTRSVDCSVRSLWHVVQSAVDDVLSKTTLQDLLRSEGEMNSRVKRIPSNSQLTFLQ
jgi:DNA-binding IscR family transcriptional regulator